MGKGVELQCFNLESFTDEEASAAVRELKEAQAADPDFNHKFSEMVDEEIRRRKLTRQVWPKIEVSRQELKEGKIWIITLLKRARWIKSSSEGRRLIKQGAVFMGHHKRRRITGFGDVHVFDGCPIHCGKLNKAIIIIGDYP